MQRSFLARSIFSLPVGRALFGPGIFTGCRSDDYPRITVLLAIFLPSFIYLLNYFGITLLSKIPPLGGDFLVFYAAGRMAIEGRAGDVFSLVEMYKVYADIVGEDAAVLGWYYPPTFILPFHLLARLPYELAFLLWTGGTAAFFAWAVAPLVHERREAWLLAAAPAVIYNFWDGQNGFLTGALVALALVNLERRKVVAGLAIGLLSIKPQLGVFLPLLLALRGQWTVFAVATASVIALSGASIAAYGLQPWLLFFTSNVEALSILWEEELFPIVQMGTPLAMLVSLGVPYAIAKGVQAVVFVVVAVTVAFAARRTASPELPFALAVTGGFLASPYGFVYDWTVLFVPALLVAAAVRRTGWLRGERAGLALFYLMPVPMLLFPKGWYVSFGCVALVGFLLVLVRRSCGGGAGPAAAIR